MVDNQRRAAGGVGWLHSIGFGGSLILLAVNFYYYCYGLWVSTGWCSEISDRLLSNIAAMGLFRSVYVSKGFALLVLCFVFVSGHGRLLPRSSLTRCLSILGAGLGLYFGSAWCLYRGGGEGWDRAYMVLTMLGYSLIVRGGGQLRLVLPGVLGPSDAFGRDQLGFPQEERRVGGAFSLHFPARYLIRGVWRSSWVNIRNPRRGVMVIGSPGCGKSRFVIEPVIRQVMEKGMPLFVFDLKFDVLSRVVWNWFTRYGARYPDGTRFYCVNFSDLSRSHRCNLLSPATLANVADAMGAARTIMLSMNKTWASREGEFFVESAINFLGALIWYLRRVKDGQYCTLPHVVELAQAPLKELLSILRVDAEVTSMVEGFVEAYQHNSHEMLDGQVASARVPLARLASPDIYYVLTGNDFSLDINDPAAPKVFCLGGDMTRVEALAPVMSLYIDRLCQRVNHPGRLPCALICDEFASVRAYAMSQVISTARSNDIIPILAVQDVSQLRTHYSRNEADMMMNISGNLVCGQVGGETAEWVAKRFPRLWQEKESISVAGTGADQSFSYSHQWEPSIVASTISTLSSGEFVGIVADDPGDRVEMKGFHGVFRREEDDVGSTWVVGLRKWMLEKRRLLSSLAVKRVKGVGKWMVGGVFGARPETIRRLTEVWRRCWCWRVRVANRVGGWYSRLVKWLERWSAAMGRLLWVGGTTSAKGAAELATMRGSHAMVGGAAAPAPAVGVAAPAGADGKFAGSEWSTELPVVREVNEDMVKAVFERVKKDVRDLVTDKLNELREHHKDKEL